MNITVEWHDKSFNVSLHAREGADAFLTIKGCRIVSGKDGEFVGFPATKSEKSGKWWAHVWGSEKFQAEVLRIANAAKPAAKAPAKATVDDDTIPF